MDGANLQNHENLLRLLYFLSELSGEERYAQAADNALKGMLLNTPSPVTGLLPWGEHMSWDVTADNAVSDSARRLHEFSRPWMLWERCFALAPEQSRQLARGLWQFHVVDHDAGGVSSSADFDGAGRPPAAGSDRAAGFFIRAWASAYAHTNDQEFLHAIGQVLARYETNLASTTGEIGLDEDPGLGLSALSMAIDCDGAARHVPEPLRTRLVRFAARSDESFCSLPHDLQQQGFAITASSAATRHAHAFTALWDVRGADEPPRPPSPRCACRGTKTQDKSHTGILSSPRPTCTRRRSRATMWTSGR